MLIQNEQTPRPSTIMRPAISIQQPWCWAILHAGKDVENRTWRTTFRGRLLIHASSKFDNAGERHMLDVMRLDVPGRDQMQRGGIVGEVDVVGCVTKSGSRWFSGPFGWVLQNPRPLPFLPCRGQLGIFNVEMPAH